MIRDEDVEPGGAAVGVMWWVWRSPQHHPWGQGCPGTVFRGFVGVTWVGGDIGAARGQFLGRWAFLPWFAWAWEYVVVAQKAVAVGTGWEVAAKLLAAGNGQRA